MGTVHGREEGARDEGRRGPGMGGGRYLHMWSVIPTYLEHHVVSQHLGSRVVTHKILNQP